MTYFNALAFAEMALTSLEPGMLELAEDVLRPGSGMPDWIGGKLKWMGIDPDPRNEKYQYERTWMGMNYGSLYSRLSENAKKQWRCSQPLMEWLSL